MKLFEILKFIAAAFVVIFIIGLGNSFFSESFRIDDEPSYSYIR